MRAPADFAYALPDGLDSAAAAPLLCAGVTVYSPLRKHIRAPGAAVAVLGVGGLGHLAVQFAHHMGAVVTAVDIDPSKESEARKLGADHFVEFGSAYTECKGRFDVIINCVSASINFPGVIGMLAPDGVAVQCGIPGGGAVINLDLQDVVFGQKALAGSIVGGRADMQEMLSLCAAKGIAPMVQVMKLSQLNEALAALKAGKPRYRIVMETDI
ncbi:adhA [Scenedesmus sp. PABB004]|nr:adhA [Scenedesmus sp. PABB004]